MSERFGFNGRVLWVDLENKSTHIETPDDSFYRQYAGGGLMGAHFLLRDTPPGIDAFDPRNLLIFLSSIIAGIRAPGLARFSVIAKSPLSGGIAEGRSEGPWGIALKESEFDAIVVRGKAAAPVYLLVDAGGIRLLPAGDLWGLDTGKTTDALMERHGNDCHIATIGLAGERLVRFASIVADRSHQAARGGLGAVMGSKNLKAVVLARQESVSVADPAGLRALADAYAAGIEGNVLTRLQKTPPGATFGAPFDISDAIQNPSITTPGYVSIENFRTSRADHLKTLSADLYLPKMVRSEGGCPGCPNDCVKSFAAKHSRDPRATGLQQETAAALGPNLGVSEPDLIIEGNTLCHLHGLDPVSAGMTISFAMESGEFGIRFGDADKILPLIEDIAHRRGVGDRLAEGVKRISAPGQPFAMHVKGIEMPTCEPRFQAGIALGYAVSPTGPRYDFGEHDWDFDTVTGWKHSLDHARAIGITERIPMEEFSERKVKQLVALSTLWSACDTLNFCIFASPPTRVFSVEQVARLVAVITGWPAAPADLVGWGKQRLDLMRAYNYREGLTAADDWLPERFFRDPIDTGRFKGRTIDATRFRESLRQYYVAMGWSEEGNPQATTALLQDRGCRCSGGL